MIKQIYNKMTDEDKEYSKTMDFEGLNAEIDDNIQKMMDLIRFKKADINDFAIIDATMTTISDILTEGTKLIKKRHQILKNGVKQ